MSIEVNGTITTPLGDTVQFSIVNGHYMQWGNGTEILGGTQPYVEAMTAAVAEVDQ